MRVGILNMTWMLSYLIGLLKSKIVSFQNLYFMGITINIICF